MDFNDRITTGYKSPFVKTRIFRKQKIKTCQGLATATHAHTVVSIAKAVRRFWLLGLKNVLENVVKQTFHGY